MLIDRPAARIAQRPDGFDVTAGAPGSFRRGHDPQAFETAGTETYDAVVATVPNDVFERMLDLPLPEAYLERMRSIEYHTALCLLLELDRQLQPLLLDQHRRPGAAVRRPGRAHQLRRARALRRPALPLRRQLPRARRPAARARRRRSSSSATRPASARSTAGFDLSWIKQRWLHREPAAQPIVTVGYPERIPPLQTGVPHLILANTTQIYPEDRGTNYAVRLGGEAAEALLSRRLNNVWSETGS